MIGGVIAQRARGEVFLELIARKGSKRVRERQCYEARRVSFFTIQLFSRYGFQEQNICASRGPPFGRGLCEDLEISTAASPQPAHVRTIELSLLPHVKFT